MNWSKKLQKFLFSPLPELPNGMISAPPEAFFVLLLHLAHDFPDRVIAAALPDSAAVALNVRLISEYCRLLQLPDPVLELPEAGRGRQLFPGGEARRARALNRVLSGDAQLILGSTHAIWGPAPPPEETRQALVSLRPGLRLPIAELLDKLLTIDYDDEYEASAPGEFARRGGIIDVYSPAHDFPCRIEYLGDEIESLRAYDPATQRSTGVLTEYRIIGRAGITAGGAANASVFDYLPSEKLLTVVFDPASGREHLTRGDDRLHLAQAFDARLKRPDTISVYPAGVDLENASVITEYPVVTLFDELAASKTLPDNRRRQENALTVFRCKIAPFRQLVILSRSAANLPELQKWCQKNLPDHPIEFAVSTLERGCAFTSLQTALITERELTVLGFRCGNDSAPVRPKPELSLPKLPEDPVAPVHLADLDEGDYAVHIDHGIGIFRGVKTLKSNGLAREVLVIEYRDGQLFYVPLLQAGKVSRYLGAVGKVPLHRLDSGALWERDKENARRGVRSYAADMLRMQAVRQTISGLDIRPDERAFTGFLQSFLFDDTPDQERATGEIVRDLASGRPMDRLLCGDVGYGKTEVAMRAAFLAVSAGYQVAVLAPTTILAQQHFQSFQERFASYPFTIDVLSRFRSDREQQQIISRLKSGALDIVIGTHRLCSEKISFANLGLVIIDEEQRFGVNHKEKLRRFRTEVNVLAMSATPIPRTLYLAMAGARSLSTLSVAPKLRMPVKTVISPDDDRLIGDAISAELARGGQVFFLHNRVRTIDGEAEKWRQRLPQCRIAVAHGQMSEAQLEETMDKFVRRKIDCLFCTTIIESGLDIPNANTIIIDRADRYGLAELYQLRGRVGRWKQQAYAYMLLPKHQLLGTDARKRLAAIRRCSTQGAGFQLALRDLEIRGSGNILGAEQSGHLNKIGFELYCQLLQLEVAKLSGREIKFHPEIDLAIDFVVFAEKEGHPELLSAVFPRSYIGGERLRIDIYRRGAALNDPDELADFKAELIDRFGKLPEPAENLLFVLKLKLLTAQTGYRSLHVIDGIVTLQNPNQEVYRLKNGKRPHLDYRDAPALRLRQLEKILLDAIATEGGK